MSLDQEGMWCHGVPEMGIFLYMVRRALGTLTLMCQALHGKEVEKVLDLKRPTWWEEPLEDAGCPRRRSRQGNREDGSPRQDGEDELGKQVFIPTLHKEYRRLASEMFPSIFF